MTTKAEQYRRKAVEAREKATRLTDEKQKAYWLAIAIEWERLVERTETLQGSSRGEKQCASGRAG